ncbi:MAG: phosphoribosylaminoimidazolesuccinocarboxamide synthase [Bacteroidales bacterium]|nr:phosphoribosylaminoimidazolesuccinocarboxamide synthase [Bacteroidales bacterium]
MKTLTKTNFNFKGQNKVYYGKVRDVYFLENDTLIMITTDRISAFDVILPQGIPYKGQVLNQITEHFLDSVSDIVPVWKKACPDPNVMIGIKCEPYPVEIIIRKYITGSLWRLYKEGVRNVCGIKLPDNLKENQEFEEPILTPTTKAQIGHDENISRDDIIKQKLIPEEEYQQIEEYAFKLFERGSKIASERGLILVDTKYEFGKYNGKIYLIDEVHTPDSSRFFIKEEYETRFKNNQPQKQLSKEFVREWLMQQGFKGEPGQVPPTMPEDFIEEVSNKYIQLYEYITGKKFNKLETDNIEERIFKNIENYLNS